MKATTDQEKAALYFAILENCQDWQRIYSIAVGVDKFNSLAETTKITLPNKWKNSARIKRLYEEIQLIQEHRENQIRQKAVQDLGSLEAESPQRKPETLQPDETDFLNRDQFLAFLNKRANEITDDKLRNDILKMLSDNMRYKENENDTTEIQRFYTPVCCQDCEIYKKCGSCSVGSCPK